ncbi:MAG TPA: fibronectin type III domain-containing protein [Candidatus Krumholzibacteria bacterium]|nr:fibronectin type III domain-containing protein [Candidatus Krumholzibacteria bacterium]
MAFRKYGALALALIISVICFGCTQDISAPVTSTDQPVLPPTNVAAVATANGHVSLSWDESSQPDIVGYNVYRRAATYGKPQQLNPNRVESTKFSDNSTKAPGQYEYRVTAVNANGKESRFTSVVVETREVIDDGSGKVPAPGFE